MKFERGNKPYESLNIGIFTVKKFADDIQAGSYIMKILPLLIKHANDPTKKSLYIVEEYIAKYIIVEDGLSIFWGNGKADPSLVWFVDRQIECLPQKICKKYGIRKR